MITMSQMSDVYLNFKYLKISISLIYLLDEVINYDTTLKKSINTQIFFPIKIDLSKEI